MNSTLKYRTFDQLLSDVIVDFQNISLENMFEPQQLIKVARRVNYDLGLRITQTRQAVLEVEKGRVKLPDDFYTLNFALICDSVTITQSMPQGTNIQQVSPVQYRETPSSIDVCAVPTVNCTKCNSLEPCNCNTCNTCNSNPCGCNTIPTACSTAEFSTVAPYGSYCTKPRVFLDCKGECWELVQIVNTTSYTYKVLLPIQILNNPEVVECDCPNVNFRCLNSGWIKDGFLHTNFKTGKVYISYQGQMEDDNGNLLVPDHELLNEYYEYALKQRILENLAFNDENVGKKLELVEIRLRAARNNALSLVNMPNFKELKSLHEMNRKAMYHKYYKMFSSWC